MKTIATLTLLLLFTLYAQGQDRKPQTKVETVTMEVMPVSQILKQKEQQAPKVVRLYRRPYARVRKALSFTTRANRPKVA